MKFYIQQMWSEGYHRLTLLTVSNICGWRTKLRTMGCMAFKYVTIWWCHMCSSIKPDILEVHLLFRFLDMATLLISCIDIANEQFERDSETCNELWKYYNCYQNFFGKLGVDNWLELGMAKSGIISACHSLVEWSNHQHGCGKVGWIACKLCKISMMELCKTITENHVANVRIHDPELSYQGMHTIMNFSCICI